MGPSATDAVFEVALLTNRNLVHLSPSWRLGNRGARELFVEQAGREVTPFDLRVGIYFADSVTATSDPIALSVAMDALPRARTTLKPLGVLPTFT